MGFDARYCSIRRDLEENGWFLTTRLSSLTSRLLFLIGTDHRSFIETKSECDETRADLVVSHRQLREHRSDHGC